MTKVGDVLEDVRWEIRRQHDLKAGGRFERTPDEMNVDEFLRVLVEEVGEIARAIHEDDIKNYAEEIFQVAAICVAHLTSPHLYNVVQDI